MPEKTNPCFSLLMSKCSGSQLGLHQLPSASNSANFCNNTDINKKLDTQKKIYEQHLLVKGVKERMYISRNEIIYILGLHQMSCPAPAGIRPFFKIRPRLDMTARFEAGFIRFWRFEHLYFPAVWWKYNASRFPILAKVVQMYLAPPPTSVPSERLFSVSGDVISEHRTRLNPDNAEKLIFMKYNASLIRLTDGMSSE